MGNYFTKARKLLFSNKGTKIIMLGLDAAGKTTILYKLKLGEVNSLVPTIGFNIEQIENNKSTITVWDVGGADKIRPLWRDYYKYSHGFIYVVDSCDTDRILESKEQLYKMLEEKEIENTILLVLANKQDIAKMTVSEISKKLELDTLKDREWHIQGTNALNGEGLIEGIEWLQKAIDQKRNNQNSEK